DGPGHLVSAEERVVPGADGLAEVRGGDPALAIPAHDGGDLLARGVATPAARGVEGPVVHGHGRDDPGVPAVVEAAAHQLPAPRLDLAHDAAVRGLLHV